MNCPFQTQSRASAESAWLCLRVPGDFRSESDAAAAGEPPRRESAGSLHHRGPDQALQLWRSELHRLQPRHLAGTLSKISGSAHSLL